MAGVILMLRPGGNELFSFGALAALVAVICYCFAVITLRMLARTDTTESMVFWFTAMLALGAGASGHSLSGVCCSGRICRSW